MRRYHAVIKLIGMLIMLFSITMLVPVILSIAYHDHAEKTFIASFLLTFLTGLALWAPLSRQNYELKTRDGFFVVALFWAVLSLFGALPFYFSLYPHLAFTDAMFESVSGLTTTGATIFSHLDGLSRSLLYYRQQLHLLGGMGVVVLAVAILPMLGIGGMQLYRAETVGPMKTSKLRPRMAETAKALWYIYAVLVIVCALAYWACGMSVFDAIGESFSTISTGGFTMHDSSFAYYHSDLINCVAILFMLLGATNFSLHFHFSRSPKLSTYWSDPEFKAYIKLLSIIILITMLVLVVHHYYYQHHHKIILNSIFTVISISSTTGFSLVDFSRWPNFLPYLLMFVAILGGCGGSTAGGMKIIRCLLLKEQSKRELLRLIHPQATLPVKLGTQVLNENVVQSIWGFVAIYAVLFVVMLLCLLATGLNIETAFGALASCISNTGAAIGLVSQTFQPIPAISKWILIAAMIIGRLEIFTVLLLFMPAYWRK